MRKITFEYWGWMMPKTQFSLVEQPEGKLLYINIDDISSSEESIPNMSLEEFDLFWNEFKSIEPEKLEEENALGRIVCDGFAITMKLLEDEKEQVTYISNPDEEYFHEYKLERCIKWMNLYKSLFDLLEKKMGHVCEIMDLRE